MTTKADGQLMRRAFERQTAALAAVCVCGARLGQHHAITAQCPNPRWRPGESARSQWLAGWTYREPTSAKP